MLNKTKQPPPFYVLFIYLFLLKIVAVNKSWRLIKTLMYALHCVLIKTLLSIHLSLVWLFADINKEMQAAPPAASPPC